MGEGRWATGEEGDEDDDDADDHSLVGQGMRARASRSIDPGNARVAAQEQLTGIESSRVDGRGIDGRTLSAVRLGGIHSGGRRCDVARQATEETWRKRCLQSDVS
ncbi:hypothetical protein F5X99DRAFT_411193 [Biscogniauxia marginata]|nr:hypothetical protein F5X99DRAFT_411193 [Biscogniauxia marginata]